jgi:Cytochrome P460
MIKWKRLASAFVLTATVLTSALLPCVGNSAEPKPESVASAKGALHVPTDYRTRYESLGSWSIAGNRAGAKEMHVVYASPHAIEGFKAKGQFADGAVLVKEVWEAETATMTTGTVSHVSQLKGWFVMVKASKNPYPNSKLWGDGWAWSWFDADNPQATTSTDYTKDCKACHLPAQNTDWIYVQGYAALK